MIPANIKPYFWEINTDKLDIKKHPEYIIARILEYGGPDAVSWMMHTYDRSQIKETLKKNREISRKSAEFWRIFYGLRKDEIACLKKSYPKKQNEPWPY